MIQVLVAGAAMAQRVDRLERHAEWLVSHRPRRAAGDAAVLRSRMTAAREGLADQVDEFVDGLSLAALEVAFKGADRCNRCGVSLRDPVSRGRGVGPDCWALLQEQDRRVEGLASTTRGTQ